MQIGVLGTGDVGRALAAGFAATGHQVVMGSRSATNADAAKWVAATGNGARAGTFADAAAFGEVLVLAVKGAAIRDIVAAAGADNFAGKVVIDPTNPLDFSRGYPDLFVTGEDSLGEQIQRLLPAALVVKAFNTAPASLMFRPTLAGGPPDMLIAGDDAPAKAVVDAILRDFGWAVIDTGPIRNARWLEAMCMAWVVACQARGTYQLAWKLLSP